MQTLIVYVSVHHGNTKKVARAMGEELDATVLEPEDLDPATVADYDLVGFGSGVYYTRVHPRLVEFARRLPTGTRQPAFVFTTSGSSGLPGLPAAWPLPGLLASKGFHLLGTFTCPGFDTWGPLRFFGGLNRGRPAAPDLDAARRFARDAAEQAASRTGPQGPNAEVGP